MLFVPALAAFAVLAQAQSPYFELQLQDVHAAVFHALQETRSGSTEEASRRVQTLDGAVGQIRWTVQDLRRRAGWIDPARGRDWFFEADLRQARHDLADLALRAKALEQEINQLVRDSGADPASAKLSAAAHGLRVEAGRLADDGRWTGRELRRAGFQDDGDEVSNSSVTILLSAFHIEQAAQRLQRRKP